MPCRRRRAGDVTGLWRHLLLLATLPAFTVVGVSRSGCVVAAGELVTSRPQCPSHGVEAVGPAVSSLSGSGQLQEVWGRAGGAVTLWCVVCGQGDRTVSWVRSRDLQILSHAGAVFTADSRFSIPDEAGVSSDTSHGAVIVPHDIRRHALRIERLRGSDAGQYECQLNTEPKMSLLFRLEVRDEYEAEETPPVVTVRAMGGGGRGGMVRVRCEARGEGADALDLRWYRAGKPLAHSAAVAAAAPRRGGDALAVTVLAAPGERYTCAARRRGGRGGELASASLVVPLPSASGQEQGVVEAMQRDQGGESPEAASAAPPRCRPRAALSALAALAALAAVGLAAPGGAPAAWGH